MKGETDRQTDKESLKNNVSDDEKSIFSDVTCLKIFGKQMRRHFIFNKHVKFPVTKDDNYKKAKETNSCVSECPYHVLWRCVYFGTFWRLDSSRRHRSLKFLFFTLFVIYKKKKRYARVFWKSYANEKSNRYCQSKTTSMVDNIFMETFK